MRIVVCFKVVPDDQEIQVRADGTLDLSSAPAKAGAYDLNAVEAAVQIVEQVGGEVILLSAGTPEYVGNSKMRKGVLARGADSLVTVADASLAEADSYATAQVLAAAIRKIGDVDLVLFGDGSADMYAQQVGLMTGYMLGIPTMASVGSVEVKDGALELSHVLEDRIEILQCETPAALCVTSDINTPRIAGMKDILAAGKKPVVEYAISDIEVQPDPKSEVVSMLAIAQRDRMKTVLDGDLAEAVAEVSAALRQAL